MLKLMCGLIATGQTGNSSGGLIPKAEPTAAALETLFEAKKLPGGSGLMIPRKGGVQLRDCVDFNIFQDDQGPVGCAVQFMYIQLMFFLRYCPTLQLVDTLYHHPSSLGITVNGRYREVHFGWQYGQHVNLSLTEEFRSQINPIPSSEI